MQEVSGEVFSYDSASDMLVLKSAGDTQHQSNLRMIRSQFVAVSRKDPVPSFSGPVVFF